MGSVVDWIIVIAVLAGAGFTLVGSLGLAKLPDFYMRLHGPTKATTLGVGAILVASMLFFSQSAEGLSLHELLVALFLFITAPVSAHILAKSAMHGDVKRNPKTRGEPWEQ